MLRFPYRLFSTSVGHQIISKRNWESVYPQLIRVIEEADFWNLIEQLKALGAEGILVVPIEKMIL
jgi:ATP phosphoribosyltransferase